MRKLFVSAIALLFVSQCTFASENVSSAKSSTENETIAKATPENKNAEAEKVVSEKKTETDKELVVEKDELEKSQPEEEVEKKEERASKSDEFTLPVIESKDFLRNVNTVLSFMNPEVIAAEPIQNGKGWVIFVELRPDIVQSLIEKDAISAIKILTLSQGVDPTFLQIVSDMIRTAVNEISSENVDILKKLNLVRNEDFKSVIEKLGLAQRYSAKINEKINKGSSFISIPFVYSSDKLSIDFSKVKEAIKSIIEIAEKIQASEKIIIEGKQERDKKITPEMQKDLDQLKSLEEENIVLKKQLEDEKARVSKNIKNSDSAKANANSEKAKVEKEISEAEKQKAAATKEVSDTSKKLSDNEKQLKANQTNLQNAEKTLKAKQNKLKTVRSEKATYDTLLKNLKGRGRIFSNALKTAKAKFNNMRLNKKSAITQTQSKIKTLQIQINASQSDVNKAQTTIKNLQSKRAQLNQEKVKRGKTKTAAEEKIKKSLNKLEILKNKKAEVESKGNNAERERKDLQSRIDAKARLVQDNESKIKTLKDMPSTQRAQVYAGDIDVEIGNQVDNIYTQYKNAATA